MNHRFKPSVTVAAIAQRNGRFLIVQEHTPDGLKLNQPAGHLEQGEALEAACARECLEETSCHFTPEALLGVYMSRQVRERGGEIEDFTYVRFAYIGQASAPDPNRALDAGIVQALWLTPEELQARAAEHRSPMVMRCINDYLAGQRFALSAVAAFGLDDAAVFVAPK